MKNGKEERARFVFVAHVAIFSQSRIAIVQGVGERLGILPPLIPLPPLVFQNTNVISQSTPSFYNDIAQSWRYGTLSLDVKPDGAR